MSSHAATGLKSTPALAMIAVMYRRCTSRFASAMMPPRTSGSESPVVGCANARPALRPAPSAAPAASVFLSGCSGNSHASAKPASPTTAATKNIVLSEVIKAAGNVAEGGPARQRAGEAGREDRAEDRGADRSADQAEKRRTGCRRAEVRVIDGVLHRHDQDLHDAAEAEAQDEHPHRSRENRAVGR